MRIKNVKNVWSVVKKQKRKDWVMQDEFTTPVMSSAARRFTEADDLEQFAPDIDMDLDPGIRRYVLIFRRAGIETIESCEGGPGHSFPEPTIRFAGNSGEGYRAASVAMTYGLPVLAIRRVWDFVDGELAGPWWEIVFRTKEPFIAAIE